VVPPYADAEPVQKMLPSDVSQRHDPRIWLSNERRSWVGDSFNQIFHCQRSSQARINSALSLGLADQRSRCKRIGNPSQVRWACWSKERLQMRQRTGRQSRNSGRRNARSVRRSRKRQPQRAVSAIGASAGTSTTKI
jgi:hypothetical protein